MPLPTLYRKGFLIGEDENIVPLDFIFDWFKNTDEKVLILQSSTGSGKSTVLPPEFYQQIDSTKDIACTQPRIINAISIPTDIQALYADKETPLVIGKNLGFQTGFISKRLTHPGVIYMTIGVLYTQLSFWTDDEIIKKYSCIFIDEAHERSIVADCTFYMLELFLERNRNNINRPYIVIMSATIDTQVFAKYLKTKSIITVKGETYPITEFYMELNSTSIYADAAKYAIKCHEEDLNPDVFRDVLVFLSGISDIRKIKKLLDNANNTRFRDRPMLILETTTDSIKKNPTEMFQDIEKLKIKMNGENKQPERRIFLSTNVAETGITIPTLKFIVDAGFFKSAEIDPVNECRLLITKAITQSMHLQRRGRVGRKAPGICYNLFTKNIYDQLQVIQYPDFIKEDITLPLLNLLVQEVFNKKKSLYENLAIYTADKFVDIFEINFLDQPSSYSIHYSLNKLFYLGAIDKNQILTPLGIIMSKFKYIPLECIKMVLSGYVYGVAIVDLIHIAICLNLEDVTNFSKVNIFNDDFINFIYYIEFLFNNVKLIRDKIADLFIAREDLINCLLFNGLDPFYNINKRLILVNETEKYEYICKIKQCIYDGFKLNIAQLRNNKYVNRLGVELTTDKHINISTTGASPGSSSEARSTNPEFIIFSDLLFKKTDGLFKYVLKKICILDGFVNIDLYMDINA